MQFVPPKQLSLSELSQHDGSNPDKSLILLFCVPSDSVSLIINAYSDMEGIGTCSL